MHSPKKNQPTQEFWADWVTGVWCVDGARLLALARVAGLCRRLPLLWDWLFWGHISLTTEGFPWIPPRALNRAHELIIRARHYFHLLSVKDHYLRPAFAGRSGYGITSEIKCQKI